MEEQGRQVDVKRHGRLADLICVAKPDVDRNLGSNTLKAALFNTGRPVMMCPPAEALETFIEPIWQRAIASEEYRLLPVQDKPVIMNVKAASASGKSTIRPQQRQLACKLGIPWEDFALVSPDYWRKYLLDYCSLGDDYWT